MRILHTADWHLGKRLDFYSRLQEQRAALREIIRIADEQVVDMVIIAGDLFDTFNPPIEATELLYSTVSKLANGGKRPVIAIAGNHDSPERVNMPDVFARTNGVIFIGNPMEIVHPFEIEDGFSILRSEGGFLEISLPTYSYPARIIHTAFANELRLKEYFGVDKQTSLQQSLQDKWHRLAEQYCDSNGVNILTTHLFMQNRNGEKLDEPEGEKPLNIGTADLVYSDAIPTAIQYTALGHLHGFQDVGSQHPAIYSSSLLRYSFSEAGHQKYVVIIDVEPGQSAHITKIPLTGGKSLDRKEFHSVAAAVDWLSAHQDSLVELTMITDEFLSAADQKQLRDSHQGIIYLIPKVKSGLEDNSFEHEINLNRNMNELFADYFRSKNDGQEPNQEIMDLFNEILHT